MSRFFSSRTSSRMSAIEIGSMPGERLVEQHDRRVGGERAGDLAAAPLAARQRHGGEFAQMRQAELAEQLLEPLAARMAGPARRPRARRMMFCSTVRPRKIEVSCGR